MKNKKLTIQGNQIRIILYEGEKDYISLTDMLKAKDGDFFISDWLRNRNSIEYIGIWESLHNPNFNYGEFAIIKSKAGLNSYKISVKEWISKTQAIGLIAKAGRYGGTYAHRDIAYEFASWISPEFKLYLIKEFQRLKEEENLRLTQGWDVKRILAKVNYKIHTDAVKAHLVPPHITREQSKVIYAHEADVLNVALFGMTAKEWRTENPNKVGNIRDYADITQLVVLSNLESINAELIRQRIAQPQRLLQLNETAIFQMQSLLGNSSIKRLEELDI